VAADRQQEAFVRPRRIQQRPSLAIDHPAFGHHLAALCLGLDLAVGGDGRRHVQHHRRFLARRDAGRDRIGRQQHVHAAPGRQVVGVAHREVEADHVVLDRHARIERRRPRMVAGPRADPGDAGAAGLVDRHRRRV
jgi:hypothetical protein